jgi:hypothetical protein
MMIVEEVYFLPQLFLLQVPLKESLSISWSKIKVLGFNNCEGLEMFLILL